MVKPKTVLALVIIVSAMWLVTGWQSVVASGATNQLNEEITWRGLQTDSDSTDVESNFQLPPGFPNAQATPEVTPVPTPTGPQAEASGGAVASVNEMSVSSILGQSDPLILAAGVLLALALVGVALALMLMAAHRFSEWLNREMPQPIYTQETRLLKVIEDSVKIIMQQTMGKDRATGHDRDLQIGLLEFERTSNAGMDLKLNADTFFGPDANGKSYRQLQTWKIEADRWGRIKKMSQDGVPRYVLIEKPPTPSETQTGVDKKEAESPKVPATALLVPTNGNYGERYNSKSETCISVTSNRRHWTD